MTAMLMLQLENARRVIKPPPMIRTASRGYLEERRVRANPKTEFGKRALELRRQIEDSDIPLLTMEEIAEEVRQRRGEREWD